MQWCFAFFAVVGLLASQLAAMPHAHEGMTATEQQAHAAKPHFHTGSHGHHHGHQHSHDHGGHFHHHDAPGKQPTDEGTNEPCHEESAVYCSPEIEAVLISKTISGDGNQLSCPILEVVETASPISDYFNRHWHPPDLAWADSHLYLSLRNLRL